MDEQDITGEEEDEEYGDYEEDASDDDGTAFDDVDYGLEEGDGEGEPSHRLANVFSFFIKLYEFLEAANRSSAV